jgi:GNAT superfamily N-acetyltransferase
LLYAVEPLASRHNRLAFDCGVESLNRYIQVQASQDVKRHIATVHVAAPTDGGTGIAGYYSLMNTGVSPGILPDELQKKMPRYNVLPAVLLGRLAVDLRHRGRQLGSGLLADAFDFSLQSPLAWVLFVTDAIDDSARDFYEHFRFRPLKDNPHHLYITRHEITRA